jgi:hypothetical protein
MLEILLNLAHQSFVKNKNDYQLLWYQYDPVMRDLMTKLRQNSYPVSVAITKPTPSQPGLTVYFPILCRSLLNPIQLAQSSELFEASFMVTPLVLQCLDNPSKIKKFFYTVRVRCFRTADSSQKHEWPTSLANIQVNNTTVSVQKRTYSRTQDNLIRTIGENAPIDINAYLQTGTNLVKIHFKGADLERGLFSIAIELFAWVSKEEAIATLLTLPKYSNSDFRTMVDSLFKPDDDECMVVQSSLQLSLTCPLTLQRMKLPVRSRLLKHIHVPPFNVVL